MSYLKANEEIVHFILETGPNFKIPHILEDVQNFFASNFSQNLLSAFGSVWTDFPFLLVSEINWTKQDKTVSSSKIRFMLKKKKIKSMHFFEGGPNILLNELFMTQYRKWDF